MTNLVKLCRKRFDQPPENNKDAKLWGWSKMSVPHDWRWCPLAIPQEVLEEDRRWAIKVAPDGEPLKPPNCWPHEIRVRPYLPRNETWCEGPRDHDMRDGPHPLQFKFDEMFHSKNYKKDPFEEHQ